MHCGGSTMTAAPAKPTKFVILTSGRSGSSWLMEMLNSHPSIGGYGELFSPRFGTRYPQTRAALYGDPGGVPFFGAYLDDRGSATAVTVPYLGTQYFNLVYAPRDRLGAVGFRVRYGHLRANWGGLPVGAWFLPNAAARRVRVVHLVRRNSLDFLVSRAVATATGLRHARDGDEMAPPRIALDTDTLVEQLERCGAHERLVRRTLSLLRLPTLEIAYEDLVSDTTRAYRRVVEFLGAQPADHKPRWRMRKVVDTPRREVIENYESVKRALDDTKYASFLD
jgi:LPS sulfotransferase NodH